MNIQLRFVFLLMMILAAAIAGFAQSKAYSLEKFGFMAGCWESAGGKDRTMSEQWMKPAGGMMMGMGRTTSGGKAVDYEFMRIEQRGEDVFFIAQPKANATETPFKLIRLDENSAVFENPGHDFPQRVMYRLTKEGSLAARIEGTVQGKAKGIDFPMVRVACN
jgi:hypothetical protein